MPYFRDTLLRGVVLGAPRVAGCVWRHVQALRLGPLLGARSARCRGPCRGWGWRQCKPVGGGAHRPTIWPGRVGIGGGPGMWGTQRPRPRFCHCRQQPSSW